MRAILRIVLLHIMVNAVAPLIVRLTYVFAIVILSEAALSYVGAGPPPPAPTLGGIITHGREFMTVAPWVTLFPGLDHRCCGSRAEPAGRRAAGLRGSPHRAPPEMTDVLRVEHLTVALQDLNDPG